MTVGLLIFFMLGYVAAIILLTVRWSRIPQAYLGQSVSTQTVSVIVPVRNEAGSILRLIESLVAQEYPHHLWEVIIVNDHSDDQTVDLVKECMKDVPMSMQLLHLGAYSGSPKKNALKLGIATAKGDLILTTDGDCSMGTQWIAAMVMPFAHSEISLVMGPVRFQIRSFFDQLQWIEFSALQGISGVLAHANRPVMGNGANLAFRKSAFEAIGGYEDSLGVASGDDEFTVKKMAAQFGGSAVAYHKSVQAIVTTLPNKNCHQLFQQRVRWASKWKKHTDVFSWLVPVYLFLCYCLLLYVAYEVWLGQVSGLFFLTLIGVKIFVEYLFTRVVSRFFVRQVSFLGVVVLEIIYPFYTLVIGIASIFGKYQWKGRKFL